MLHILKIHEIQMARGDIEENVELDVGFMVAVACVSPSSFDDATVS